jgi:hypothetical protein
LLVVVVVEVGPVVEWGTVVELAEDPVDKTVVWPVVVVGNHKVGAAAVVEDVVVGNRRV